LFMSKIFPQFAFFAHQCFRACLLSQGNPDPSCCLGVFGLSLYTTERDLREVFSKYGPLSDVNIVYDQQSRRSRGFAFVYLDNSEDAKEVRGIKWGFTFGIVKMVVMLIMLHVLGQGAS